MLESALNLLKVCQTEAKKDKLREAVRTHRAKAEQLRAQIKQTRGEDSQEWHVEGRKHSSSRNVHVVVQWSVLFQLYTELCTCTGLPSAQQEALAMMSHPPPSPSPPTPTQPLLPEQQRSKVIEELLSTEKDFLHQMEVCCEVVVPALTEVGRPAPADGVPVAHLLPSPPPKVPGINTDILFGNMEDIVRVSRRLLHAMEGACTEQQMVGEVFMTFAPQMREVYAVYCRNHDSAAALVEKVKGI